MSVRPRPRGPENNAPRRRRPETTPATPEAPQPAKPLPAHVVAYVVGLLVLVAGVLGGFADAPARLPGWALRSELVYHVEVAGVLLAAGYLVVVLLVLGWDNATLTKLTLGPAGAEAPEKAAAAQLEELKRAMSARDDKTAQLLGDMNDRLDRVDPPNDDGAEAGQPPADPSTPRTDAVEEPEKLA